MVLPPIHFFHNTVNNDLISYLCTVYTPAFSALVADSIPPERRGVGYALRNMIPSIATIFAPAIVGLLVKEYGIVSGVRFGYAIVIGFYVISIIIRGKYLEETLEGTEPFEPKHVFSLLTESFVSIPEVWRTMPNNFKNYLAATLLSAFTGPLVFPLMAFYAVDVIGITSIQWGYLGTIGIAVNLLASYPLGKLVDRIPRKTAIIISYISWLPILGLFIVSRSYNSLVIFFILDALNRALSMPAFLGMIADLVPRESRGRIGSVERTLGSIVSTLAFAVSGFLYQSNPVYPFTIALVLESITLLLVIFILKEPESREV